VSAATGALLGCALALLLSGCKATDVQDTSHEDGGATVVSDPDGKPQQPMSTEPTLEDASVAPARDAGGTAGQPSGVHDAGTAASRDAAVALDAGPAPLDCDAFPTFDRTCDAANDCAVALRQVNCCGGMVATGVGTEDTLRFASAASECASKFPLCGCAAGPTTADDGTTGGDGAAATVACVGGVCSTTFSSGLKACGPNGLGCDAATEICVSKEPVGPAIIYECKPVPAGCDNDRTCACLASTLCAPGYDSCFDDDADVLQCVCPFCQ
jgi:hypothetical protein